MSQLQLVETSHPRKDAAALFESLVGIDDLKETLIDELTLILDKDHLQKWLKRHHPKGLSAANTIAATSPLILLSGEVGCGKTALASSVGTPLAHQLDRKVISFETPSDVRGRGLVGELSARITESFEQARAKIRSAGCGLLIIDEADDLATSREQMQAHHEDRAGVNVLIKQIDRVVREQVPMAVLMITNRSQALDAALMRRTSLHMRFERPNESQRKTLMEHILSGTRHTQKQMENLLEASAPRHGIPFSFSDLSNRVARYALRRACKQNRAFDAEMVLEALDGVEPSPLVEAPSKKRESHHP